MKKQLIHFLNWMNRKAADEPMSLETDHDDIAMMYLAEYPTKEGNCPTCHSEVEIGGKEGETRWFVPKTEEIDFDDVARIWNNTETGLSFSYWIKENYNLSKKIK